MRLNRLVAVFFGLLILGVNCSSNSGVSGGGGGATTGQGGSSASGGASPIGGKVASGGSEDNGGTVASGGTLASGGQTASNGGHSGASGGSMSSGGTIVASGGASGSGGQAVTGGAAGAPAGGAPASGGKNGTSAGGGSGSGGSGVTVDSGSTGDGAGGPAVPSSGCGKTRTLADGNNTIQSGGTARTYYLKTPSNYDNTHPYRTIFEFHWNGGSANSIVNPPDQDHNTDRPFYGFADLSGDTTIYVVPNGISAGWANTNNRDVTFTDDMLAAITGDLCIDTSRIFTTGFSWGAAMSYELACVRPTKFRAAVVYEVGPVSGNNPSQCTTPIAWFQSHGVDDQVFSYQQTGISVLNVFTKLNGCTAMTPPTPPTNGHTCTSFQGCSHPTRFCSFGSGENNPYNTSLRGHYPSAKDPGQTTSWVPAEAWSYITQF